MQPSENRYAVLCASVFRKYLGRFGSGNPERELSNRPETVAAIGQALAQRGRRVVFRKQLARGGAISAAALVLLVAGWTVSRRLPGNTGRGLDTTMDTPLGRTLTVLGGSDPGRLPLGIAQEQAIQGLLVAGSGSGSGTDRRPLMNGMTLEPGTGLVAPAGSEIKIGSSDGTTLTLEKGAELTVVEQSTVRHFTLRAGAVRAHVAKLPAAERFIIATDDAEVEVHGTIFRVARVPSDPACGGGVRTRVSVFEGVVSVRAGGTQTFIRAGGEWPDACGKPEAIAERQIVERPAGIGVSRTIKGERRGTQPRRTHMSRRTLSTSRSTSIAAAQGDGNDVPASVEARASASPSVLVAQNDLFASAIRAKRQKRMGDSARLFSQLVDSYPEGPLTEAAMAQRMKVLGGVDGTAAARAASEYLARFPGGFARAEARRLAGPGQ